MRVQLARRAAEALVPAWSTLDHNKTTKNKSKTILEINLAVRATSGGNFQLKAKEHVQWQCGTSSQRALPGCYVHVGEGANQSINLCIEALMY